MGDRTGRHALSDDPRAARHRDIAPAPAGISIEQIANDIGMSLQMVEHYLRFRDQMEVAEGGQRNCNWWPALALMDWTVNRSTVISRSHGRGLGKSDYDLGNRSLSSWGSYD